MARKLTSALWLAFVVMLAPAATLAQETAQGSEQQAAAVTFSLPPEFAGQTVSWSATPLDLGPDADVLEAMIFGPESSPDPWVAPLPAGQYLISAFSDTEVFELEITVDGTNSASHIVPVVTLGPTVVFSCTGSPTCTHTDAESGLTVTLPDTWALEAPYRADLGDGEQSEALSTVFFEDIETGDGGTVWFLNPTEWIEDEYGPCRDVSIGQLCTFELTDKAEAAFAIIAPSLELAEAE